MTQPLAAVTGATGFIGRRLVPALARAGWRLRLLMRRDPVIPEWKGVHPQIVAGTLSDAAALERLVEGADVVIHVAGLIKAARRADFFAINEGGAAAMAAITQKVAPRAHFILISTLAAREPRLSDYAASKRGGEDIVRKILGTRSTVVRPTAVYGPGDRETLAFFKLAQLKRIPLIGRKDALVTLIHVDDLVSLIVALAAQSPSGAVMGACDARPAGYRWSEVFTAAANAVGNSGVPVFHVPAPLLHSVAMLGDIARLFGHANMLTSDKLRELRHLDWSIPTTELARVPGWSPQYSLEAGFADAVHWYRSVGWL